MMYNKEKRIMDIKYLVPKELIMEIKDEIIEIVGALFKDNVLIKQIMLRAMLAIANNI